VATIVKRAVQRTVEEHQLVGLLSVADEGVSFTELKRVAGEKDQEALREGFKLLVANLFDILAEARPGVRA